MTHSLSLCLSCVFCTHTHSVSNVGRLELVQMSICLTIRGFSNMDRLSVEPNLVPLVTFFFYVARLETPYMWSVLKSTHRYYSDEMLSYILSRMHQTKRCSSNSKMPCLQTIVWLGWLYTHIFELKMHLAFFLEQVTIPGWTV